MEMLTLIMSPSGGPCLNLMTVVNTIYFNVIPDRSPPTVVAVTLDMEIQGCKRSSVARLCRELVRAAPTECMLFAVVIPRMV